MCVRYSRSYQSCEHPGKVYTFPCSDPTQCGQTTCDPKVLDFCLDFPDFCPQCLLTGRFSDSNSGSNSLPNVNATDGSAIDSLSEYRMRSIVYNIMKYIWERAKNDLTYPLEDDNFITENAVGPSGSAATTARRLLRLVNGSFWHILNDRQESPSRFQRLFLIQLNQFVASSEMKTLARKHSRREAIRSVRRARIMDLVTPVDLGSLAHDEDHNCSICIERLGQLKTDGTIENPVRTQCQHIFGKHCLRTWIGEHESCPICRRELLALSETEDPSAPAQDVARANQPMPIWLRRFLRINEVDAEEDLLNITGSSLLLFFTDQLEKELGVDNPEVLDDFDIREYDAGFLR